MGRVSSYTDLMLMCDSAIDGIVLLALGADHSPNGNLGETERAIHAVVRALDFLGGSLTFGTYPWDNAPFNSLETLNALHQTALSVGGSACRRNLVEWRCRQDFPLMFFNYLYVNAERLQAESSLAAPELCPIAA